MARFDYVGLFWEDKNRHGILHSFDDSWRPRDFPNLSNARVLGIDIETYDPETGEKTYKKDKDGNTVTVPVHQIYIKGSHGELSKIGRAHV